MLDGAGAEDGNGIQRPGDRHRASGRPAPHGAGARQPDPRRVGTGPRRGQRARGHHRPQARRGRLAARWTAPRTSSSRRWRTSCATRWRRFATRCRSCTARPASAPRVAVGAVRDRPTDAADDPAHRRPASTSRGSRSNRLELRSERSTWRRCCEPPWKPAARSLRAGGQEFAVTLPAEPIYLDADPARLAQAVSNLLNNAAKYTERGGRIWLTAERADGDASSPCATPASASRRRCCRSIFDMFTQGEQSRARSAGRPGHRPHAGQAAGRDARRHDRRGQRRAGGRVARSSYAFRSSRRRGDVASPGARTVSRWPALAPHPGRGRQSRCRRQPGDALAHAGNEMRTAYDGLEALEVANGFRPEVGLLDIGLPKVGRARGGPAAAPMEPWGQQMRLIAITGWSTKPIAPGRGPRASTTIWSSLWTRAISPSCWLGEPSKGAETMTGSVRVAAVGDLHCKRARGRAPGTLLP